MLVDMWRQRFLRADQVFASSRYVDACVHTVLAWRMCWGMRSAFVCSRYVASA